MEKALQQRLIGAAVLVLAGVVFIPLLLDGAGYNARFSQPVQNAEITDIKIKAWDEIQQIPAEPDPSSKPERAEKPTVKKSEIKPKQKPTEKKPVSKPVIKQPSIKAWALQVGSFSQQTNALVLRDQLRAKGYKAFLDKTRKNNVTQYKVKVGPELDRTRLETVAKKLKNKEKLKSLLMTHP